jgi:hypothetical protein
MERVALTRFFILEPRRVSPYGRKEGPGEGMHSRAYRNGRPRMRFYLDSSASIVRISLLVVYFGRFPPHVTKYCPLDIRSFGLVLSRVTARSYSSAAPHNVTSLVTSYGSVAEARRIPSCLHQPVPCASCDLTSCLLRQPPTPVTCAYTRRKAVGYATSAPTMNGKTRFHISLHG